MPFHSNLGAGNNHVPYNWTYNTEAARVADSGFVSADEGKLARQLDNNSLWLLANATTAEWVAVGSSGGLTNESYTNFTYGTTTPLKISTVQANKRLIYVGVYLDTAFDANDASLTVGTLADGDLFVTDAGIDITVAGTSEFAFSYKVSVDTDIYLNIVPGTATTTGSGMIVVRSEP